MKSVRLILIALFLVFCSGMGSANGTAYVYLLNWTEGDLQVYIDGQNYGVASKGANWYYVDSGHHKIETYRCSDPWYRSRHCAYVGCFPKGEVYVQERDF